ncbi:MAG: hypothetical protein JNN08_10350 [Bryobacterales bacterium]|nr:hypothetical protein [Bryobacterales bacterium]
MAAGSHLDPLLQNLEFPHEAVFFPLGFPLVVRTNDPRVLEQAQTSWGMFTRLHAGAPLELLVGVVDCSTADLPPEPVTRARRHLITVAGDSNHYGVTDFAAGVAICWTTPRAFDVAAHFRYFYLEAFGYMLVAERYLTAIHASCVISGRSCVLLCGPSGAGKSSLAYACARRGWTYLADDATFLVRSSPDLTVVGNCHRIRFRPDARVLFPELENFLEAPRPNGKMTIEVSTNSLPIANAAPTGEATHVVFLNRVDQGPAGCRPFDKDEASRRLEAAFCYGRESSQREQRASLSRLLDRDIFEITYSDLDPAVDALEALVR